MENSQQIATAGPGLTTLLTMLFITLKLCGVIAWSWVWVLSPIWISIGLVVALLGVAGILMCIGKRYGTS